MIARFFVYNDSDFVEIELHEGQSVEFENGGKTDEGYLCTRSSYEFDGEKVTATHLTEGRDCDGYSADYLECECKLENLRSRTVEYYDEDFTYPPLPEWERVDSYRRDQYAEMAGY